MTVDTHKYAARSINLDLLLYDYLIVKSAVLTLPDPDITRRAFLAIPLCEQAPDIVIPGINVPICVIARECPALQMEALPKLTAQLRSQLPGRNVRK